MLFKQTQKKIRRRAIIKNNNELKNETKTKLIADQNWHSDMDLR